mgnify:CR=1 FL=1
MLAVPRSSSFLVNCDQKPFTMPANKATPKGEITLLSKGDDGWKFAHSPSGVADFSVKQKLGKKFTFGVGFTVSCGPLPLHLLC